MLVTSVIQNHILQKKRNSDCILILTAALCVILLAEKYVYCHVFAQIWDLASYVMSAMSDINANNPGAELSNHVSYYTDRCLLGLR